MPERYPQPELGTESEVLGTRIAALFADGLVVFGLSVALAFVVVFVTAAGGNGLLAAGLLYLLFPLVVLGYQMGTEAYYGRTPGKMLLGLVVVRTDGSRCTPGAAVIRNLLRIVDALPTFYLIGVVTMLLTDRNQRLGDLLAGTVVVETADETVDEEWTPDDEDAAAADATAAP